MAKIIKKFYTLYRTEDDNNDYFWIKNEGSSDTHFFMSRYDGWDEPLEFSFDKINWISYDEVQNYNWSAGSKLFIRNPSGVLSSSENTYVNFRNNNNYLMSIGGDMTTLVNYTLSNKKEILTLPDYCFYNLFFNSSLLSVDCNIGNVQTLGWASFGETFRHSYSLESVSFDMSKVKASGTKSFTDMFDNCSALTSVNIDLSSLETLGSNRISNGMNGMFRSCGALTSINIDLSSLKTIGYRGMQSMFRNCTSLTKGLDLKSVTTVVDCGMQEMYYFCYNLTEVYAPNVSTWDYSKTPYWLQSVSSSGVVYKPANLTIPRGSDSGIPSGWTTQDYPEE